MTYWILDVNYFVRRPGEEGRGGKVYTSFKTKTAQKPYPMGRHMPI